MPKGPVKDLDSRTVSHRTVLPGQFIGAISLRVVLAGLETSSNPDQRLDGADTAGIFWAWGVTLVFSIRMT